jgi:alkylresorcinol/alkylpyrone synthase
MMPKILAAAKAVPPYDIPQSFAMEFAGRHFRPHHKDLDRLLKIFESSRVENRQFCVPPDWFSSPKSFAEKNDTFIEWACKLGAEASRACLERAKLTAQDIDHIIFVTTTGLATPSIDARLINILGLRNDVKRTPIWGLGCVGGAMGLSRAADLIIAWPSSKVLLVAVELCGLTFQFGDWSKSNLVATALFGDGAAAVILSGDGDGPEILASQSTTWPNSLDVMGWNILNEGMQVVFARAIPGIVREHARKNFEEFLSRQNGKLDDIAHFLIHPGGAKVIDAYQEALGIDQNRMRLSEEILRDHGNMSSVTVLYILERFMREQYKSDGSLGIISALGPGFSSEAILFKS